MAPEIIEMSGGGTKSDIWSLGCTVVELFTGNPPYFDLSTMQALFNIVEDESVPLPPNLTKEATHFLNCCCFIKDPKKRFAAEVLLQHPWLQNSQTSFSSYEEVHSIIKKHNTTRQTSLDGLWKNDEKESIIEEKIDEVPQEDVISSRQYSNPLVSDETRALSSRQAKHKSDHRKVELISLNSPSTTPDKNSRKKNAKQELINAILSVSQERDNLMTENEELRLQLQKLELELQTLKNNS